MKNLSLIFIISCFLISCDWFKSPTPQSTLPDFETNPTVNRVPDGVADEASGIVDSRNIAGHVWTHEDGLQYEGLILLNHQGQQVKRFALPIFNRDWEDLAIGPGPQNGINYLYIADIGDNFKQWEESYIYRFAEPKTVNDNVGTIEKITFKYPDGKYNAECILVDPTTKDIYIITKEELNVRLYQLPYPQSTTETITAKFVRTIPYNLITGGSVASDGKQIIIRSYFVLFYFIKKDSESFADALGRASDMKLPYVLEPLGEAVCFDRNDKGYFTISEAGDGKTGTNLYYYARK